MKYFFLSVVVLAIIFVAVMGFQGDKRQARPWQWLNEMDQQQKVTFQQESKFFADGRSARLPIPGTVHHGLPTDQEYLLTGMMNGQWGDGIPVPVTAGLMARGQERYGIYCAVCHSTLGNGQGVTSKYGLNGAANLLLENYRKMADGEIFNTIGMGKGQMLGLAANIVPEDRWAIVAYIRALQRSQNGTMADVPEAEKSKLGAP
jgi:mono/diheme cytochrome c family protein